MSEHRLEVWAAGDAYEPYIGRWSRPVARELLAWLAPGGMELIRRFWDAAAALDPAAADLDAGRRFPLCRPEPLAGLFRAAGLAEVVVGPIRVPTRFRDFDDYWTPFLGGQGPAPGYALSLAEPRRAALREALRARLPAAADGSIPLRASAWAVAGVSGG